MLDIEKQVGIFEHLLRCEHGCNYCNFFPYTDDQLRIAANVCERVLAQRMLVYDSATPNSIQARFMTTAWTNAANCVHWLSRLLLKQFD